MCLVSTAQDRVHEEANRLVIQHLRSACVPSELIERFKLHLHVQDLSEQPAVSAASDAGTQAQMAWSGLEQLVVSHAPLPSSTEDEGLPLESEDDEPEENSPWGQIRKRAYKLCGFPEDHFVEDESINSESAEVTSSTSEMPSIKEDAGLLRKVSSSRFIGIAQDALRLPRSNGHRYESLRDLIPRGARQGDAHGPKLQCRPDSASPRIANRLPELRLPRRWRRLVCLGLSCCLPFAHDEVDLSEGEGRPTSLTTPGSRRLPGAPPE
eukprot:TRINITY_DN49001_c0_g1_i1.p1 TRINITY_DN49001_c0_g1~~TRINITY_DN49001_c0_g1_i1.p1  ORF type:complete len:267 (-),score=41.93 TRINITY_DN49001_c0_g1_i1:245-1045(-)